MKDFFRLLMVAIFGLPLSPIIAAQGTGAIRGTVVDEKGVTVRNAKVNVRPMSGVPSKSILQYAETDEEGHFLIDHLRPGPYGVFAMKEESGYPDMSASLYSDDVFPTVTITPSSPVAEVRISLGPIAGIVAGSVTDATTGAPLNSDIKLIRAAASNKWLSTSAPPNYRILLPSSTDVRLEVSAPGFKTWTPPSPLRLQPGAELHLDIALEPSHDPNLHPSKFLVPDRYVGWLLLEYNVKDAEPVRIEAGVEVFKFPPTGTLTTSSPGPQRGAEDEYFYYSADGSVREIPTHYRSGNGIIWGQHEGTRNGTLSQFGFFVGSEEQYKKYQARATHPGPISNP